MGPAHILLLRNGLICEDCQYLVMHLQPASCTACLQIALLRRKGAEAAKAVEQLREETSTAKAALVQALQASSGLPRTTMWLAFLTLCFLCSPDIRLCMHECCYTLPVVLPSYQAL